MSESFRSCVGVASELRRIYKFSWPPMSELKILKLHKFQHVFYPKLNIKYYKSLSGIPSN